MRNVRRVLVVMAFVAAGASSSFARADDPAQRPSPPGTGQQQPAPGTGQQQPAPASGRQQPAPPGAGQQATPPQGQKTEGASEANGIVQMIDEALGGIDLRPDQKDTLQKLGAEVDTKVAAVDQAKRDLLTAIADQVETGKVDEASLKGQEQHFADAAADACPDVRRALEKIHDTLDPAQRKQFVTNFREAMKKHGGRMNRKPSIDELSSTLNLTDDQKKKIADVLEQDTVAADVARAKIELVLAAFPAEHFKLDELLPPPSATRDRVREMADHIADVAAKVTDILTPDQRKTAAQHIRDKVSGKSGVSQTTAGLETTDTASDPIWVGGARGVATGYRASSGYGFAGGMAGGWGGAFLI